MKKVLCLSLITCSIFSMQLDLVKSAINRPNFENKVNKVQEKLLKHINSESKVRIEPKSVFIPHQLGSVELYHGKKGFSVIQDDKKHEIKKYFTDPMVRNIDKKQLKFFLKAGYLSLNQMDDGEFSLKAKGRIIGGGPGGATAGAVIGRVLAWGIGVTITGIISAPALIGGPVAFAGVWAATTGAATPYIEGASHVTSIAGGIIGGVATGPV